MSYIHTIDIISILHGLESCKVHGKFFFIVHNCYCDSFKFLSLELILTLSMCCMISTLDNLLIHHWLT